METCQVCGNKVGDFDVCTHEKKSAGNLGGSLIAPFVTSSHSSDFSEIESGAKSITPFIFGPFFAIIFDVIFPTWSTLWVSLGLVILATLLVNATWSQIGTGIPFSISRFLKSLPWQLVTPKLIRLHSTNNKFKQQLLMWVASVIVATFAVLWIGTPGNGKGLEKALQDGIRSKTGQSLGVKCPSIFTTFPGSTTTCHVKLVLGLKVPIRVTVSGVLGNISWNASLN